MLWWQLLILLLTSVMASQSGSTAAELEYTLDDYKNRRSCTSAAASADDHDSVPRFAHPPQPQMTGSSSVSSTESCRCPSDENDSSSSDDDDRSGGHRHHSNKVSKLLAALSFERLLPSAASKERRRARKLQQQQKQPENYVRADASSTCSTGMIQKELRPPASLPNSRLLSYGPSCTTKQRTDIKVLFGTLDPEGGDDDNESIFFDAHQKGDASEDAFTNNYQRESVLLSSILHSDATAAVADDYSIEVVSRKDSKENDTIQLQESSSSWMSIRAGDSQYHGSRESPRVPPPPPPRSPSSSNHQQQQHHAHGIVATIPMPPPPPQQLPLRFLRAAKGDPAEGMRRYQATLAWRAENTIDTILHQPMPDFALIKQHYPHYCHGTGKNGEPCFYEQPPKTDLKALRAGGVTLDKLLRHYSMVSEYQWQYVCRDDLRRSIYIIDLQGIRMGDFVGEVVDFVKKASALSATHYPERAGSVFVINVPSWFRFIWSVVKPWVDEVTLQKISILRGEAEVRDALAQRIDLEQIPIDYGGSGGRLGESPEEQTLRELAHHNNAIARGEQACPGLHGGCKFCTWAPPRSY